MEPTLLLPLIIEMAFRHFDLVAVVVIFVVALVHFELPAPPPRQASIPPRRPIDRRSSDIG